MIHPCSLEAHYADALVDYIGSSSESTLGQAYELGRQGLEQGMGILDMTEVHHAALAEVLSQQPQSMPPALQCIESSRRFLLETLAAFEMAHRGFREANMVLRQFNEALEEAIGRVAHVLHDHTGQLIAAINLEFDRMEDLPAGGIRQRIVRVRELVTQVEEQMRRLTQEIRPPVLDDLGLLPAIEFLRDGLEQRSKVSIDIEGAPDQRYPKSIEIAVYRTVQEALTNVVKHAQATRVQIALTCQAGRLVCSVRDDGIGFDVAAQASTQRERGLGLLAMKQRLQRIGGECEIHSAAGHGTEIRLSIQLEK